LLLRRVGYRPARHRSCSNQARVRRKIASLLRGHGGAGIGYCPTILSSTCWIRDLQRFCSVSAPAPWCIRRCWLHCEWRIADWRARNGVLPLCANLGYAIEHCSRGVTADFFRPCQVHVDGRRPGPCLRRHCGHSNAGYITQAFRLEGLLEWTRKRGDSNELADDPSLPPDYNHDSAASPPRSVDACCGIYEATSATRRVAFYR